MDTQEFIDFCQRIEESFGSGIRQALRVERLKTKLADRNQREGEEFVYVYLQVKTEVQTQLIKQNKFDLDYIPFVSAKRVSDVVEVVQTSLQKQFLRHIGIKVIDRMHEKRKQESAQEFNIAELSRNHSVLFRDPAALEIAHKDRKRAQTLLEPADKEILEVEKKLQDIADDDDLKKIRTILERNI